MGVVVVEKSAGGDKFGVLSEGSGLLGERGGVRDVDTKKPAGCGTGRAGSIVWVWRLKVAQEFPEIRPAIHSMNSHLRMIFGLLARRSGSRPL